MREWITAVFLITGALFALLSAIGILKMPDVFTRMHASTKSGTLGVGCILIALAIYFNHLGITTRAFLIISFLVLTIPIGAHMIARAAYFTSEAMSRHTVLDEMRDRCDLERHEISSCSTDDMDLRV
jgi:multicomponent Na+:H+ antiporter subunit G